MATTSRDLRPADADLIASLREGGVLEPDETLFVEGELPALGDAVAIVGTRKPDPDARAFAVSLATSLARRGVLVVSGGARGIDAGAHEGALVAGAPTVAVLASLAPPYPAEHDALFAQVRSQGALISTVRGGASTTPRFFRRNRLLARLVRAVVVVEAGVRSGALSTAAHARRAEVPLLAVPHAPWEPRGAGNVALLARGAAPCTSARDVLAVLGTPDGRDEPSSTPARSPRGRPPRSVAAVEGGARAGRSTHDAAPRPTGLAGHVYDCLGARPRHLYELEAMLDAPAPALLAALAQLEVEGLVTSTLAGYHVVRRPRAC